MVDVEQALAVNRRIWDARARIHVADRTGFYGLEEFLTGDNSLDALDEGDLGDLTGVRVAHLQCHFGLDTLKLARMGAEATGLDFSPVAIAEARKLAARSGVQAEFVEADALDAAQALGPGRFDLVYVTWGALGWLPDIRRWARQVAALLVPGGRLFLREGHPSAMFLELVDGRLVPTYDWRSPTDRPDHFVPEGTYTGDETPLPETGEYEWIHPLSSVIGALLEAGMRLDALEEAETLAWDMWPGLTERGADGNWRLPEGHPRLPLSYKVKAVREG